MRAGWILGFLTAVVAAQAAGTAAAIADDYVLLWDGRGGTSVALRGPQTVVVAANPIRFAWALRVNEKLISGPALDRALTGTSSGQTSTTSTTPTAAVAAVAASALGNIAAGTAAGSAAPPSSDTNSPFQGGRLAIAHLGSAGPVVTAAPPCPTASIDAITDCVKQLESDVTGHVDKADQAFKSLSMLADVDINAIAAYVDGFLSRHPLDTAKHRNDFDSAVNSELLPVNGPIDKLRLEYRNLLPYPFAALATDGLRAAALQQAVATLQGQEQAANKTTTDKLAKPSLTAANPEDKLKAASDQLKSAADELKASAARQAQLTALAKRISDTQARLGQYDDKSQNGKSYALVLNQVSSLFKTTINTLQPSSFYSVRTEPCAGLSDSSKQTTIEIDVGADTSQAVVSCVSRVFVSSGFAFSSLPQRTYSAVIQNPLAGTAAVVPPATPAPSAAPFAVIVDSNVSQVRPIPAVLANVRLNDAPNPLYGSFGVTLSSSSTSSVFDYLGGLSYSLDRTLTLTGGVHLGQITELASGYRLGDLIAPGSAPQTTTRLKTGIFLGITFGNH